MSFVASAGKQLWQSVRWQLQQQAADLVRYWVWTISQLGMLLQDFLLKLNIRLPLCRTSLLETSMVTNCVPLLRTTGKLWRPSIAIDSLPGLRGSAWWRLQRFLADLVRCLVIRHLRLALRREDLLFKLEISLSQCRAISMGTRKSNNCVLLLSPTRALRQPTITIDRMPVLRCSVRCQLQHLAAGPGRYWVVGLLQLASLLQDLLLKLSICLLFCRTVQSETSMANNCVPLLGTTRTLWRPSTTIDSVPALWCSVRWQLQGLAVDMVRY